MFEGGSPANEMQAVSFIGALKVPVSILPFYVNSSFLLNYLLSVCWS